MNLCLCTNTKKLRYCPLVQATILSATIHDAEAFPALPYIFDAQPSTCTEYGIWTFLCEITQMCLCCQGQSGVLVSLRKPKRFVRGNSDTAVEADEAKQPACVVSI